MIKLVQDKLGVTDKSRIITAIVQLRENNQELTLNNIAIKLFSY
jgi:DNA-binding transcriptional regulator WhiA